MANKKEGSNEKVLALMYAPAYRTRASNEGRKDEAGKPDPEFHNKLMTKAAARDGYEVKFVNSAKATTEEMTKITKEEALSSLKYFGHANSDTMLLNYGERRPATGSEDYATETIRTSDITKAIDKKNLTSNAKIESFGCNQGDRGGMMEQLRDHYNVETIGSKGKTQYGPIGGGEKFPTSDGGYETYKKKD